MKFFRCKFATIAHLKNKETILMLLEEGKKHVPPKVSQHGQLAFQVPPYFSFSFVGPSCDVCSKSHSNVNFGAFLKSSHKSLQWPWNVFEDTEDKLSCVLLGGGSHSKIGCLQGFTFKNRTFSRLCSKIWCGHVPMFTYVLAPLHYVTTVHEGKNPLKCKIQLCRLEMAPLLNKYY